MLAVSLVCQFLILTVFLRFYIVYFSASFLTLFNSQRVHLSSCSLLFAPQIVSLLLKYIKIKIVITIARGGF